MIRFVLLRRSQPAFAISTNHDVTYDLGTYDSCLVFRPNLLLALKYSFVLKSSARVFLR